MPSIFEPMQALLYIYNLRVKFRVFEFINIFFYLLYTNIQWNIYFYYMCVREIGFPSHLFSCCVLCQVLPDSFGYCIGNCSYAVTIASWFVFIFVKIYLNLFYFMIYLRFPVFIERAYSYLFIQYSMWDMGFHLPVNLFCSITYSVPKVWYISF